jgi:hypothetical protein
VGGGIVGDWDAVGAEVVLATQLDKITLKIQRRVLGGFARIFIGIITPIHGAGWGRNRMSSCCRRGTIPADGQRFHLRQSIWSPIIGGPMSGMVSAIGIETKMGYEWPEWMAKCDLNLHHENQYHWATFCLGIEELGKVLFDSRL